MGGKIDPLGSCAAFLSKICALRNDASMPMAGRRQDTALGAGWSSLWGQYTWEGQGSAECHDRAALLREKRAGCGNANFLRKKAVLPGCSAAKRCACSDSACPTGSKSQKGTAMPATK